MFIINLRRTQTFYTALFVGTYEQFKQIAFIAQVAFIQRLFKIPNHVSNYIYALTRLEVLEVLNIFMYNAMTIITYKRVKKI